jgi:glycosyltransferase involved in cell wall biosynthesis
MKPSVSIIVPTFNRLKYLRRTIESVFQQTFCDWELLIADDGSTAETQTYLRALHNPPGVRVLWLPHTGRPSVARNAALREARGEYVAFLDSDDVWLPAKLQIQIDSLRSHPDRRWGYTRFVLVDESGTPTLWQRSHSWPVPGGWIFDNLVKSHTVIAVPSVVASRALLQQVGGFDEDLIMCEDYDLWLKLAALSEVDAIDEPCTLVTRHAEHSGSALTSFQDCARVFQKVLDADGTQHLHSIVREKLAEVAYGLVTSHAARGDRRSAVRTLVSSAPSCWRYPYWWYGALRAIAPQAVVELGRKYRSGRRVERAAQP